jgi:hypothetical protein
MAWTLGTGYAVETGQAMTLDVFGGLRYFGLEASTDWQLAGVITGPGAGQTFPRMGGISENINGLVRWHLPKGADFSKIAPEQLARMQSLLNSRPRKCLGYRTLLEVAASSRCTSR